MGQGFTVCGSRQGKYGYRLTESTCSVCGRKFMRGDEHAYRAGGKMQCSYTCYRIPEEEERRKFRENLDKKIAMSRYVDEHKNTFYLRKKPKIERPASKTEERLAGALEAAIKEIETCEAWVHMFTARVNRYEPGTAERKRAQTSASKWRKKLEAAQQAADRLKEEMEAKKNVRIPEEEAGSV